VGACSSCYIYSSRPNDTPVCVVALSSAYNELILAILAGVGPSDEEVIKSSTEQDAEQYFASVHANDESLCCEVAPVVSDAPATAKLDEDKAALDDVTWATLPVRRGPTGVLSQSMQELD
jgi:hypothetical protein